MGFFLWHPMAISTMIESSTMALCGFALEEQLQPLKDLSTRAPPAVGRVHQVIQGLVMVAASMDALPSQEVMGHAINHDFPKDPRKPSEDSHYHDESVIGHPNHHISQWDWIPRVSQANGLRAG